MDVESLQKICNREFRMINGLYHPTDTIRVEDRSSSIFCEYRSNRYSTKNPDDDSYEDSTKIMFDEFYTPTLGINAMIGFLAVHPQVRGHGFGKKMVEAVGSIFKQRGWDKVDVENVDNPEFWLKMGYTPRTIRERDDEYEFYTKRLS